MQKITLEDFAKIEEEIRYRKLVVRKKAIEAVKEARAHGDLSENFEYYAAKKDKNQNESRIRYLETLLKRSEIINDVSDKNEVGLYNTVNLYLEEEEEDVTFQIVTSIRGNSTKGLISIDSPVGKAILGREVGERVYVQVNDNYGYFVIIKGIIKTNDDGSLGIRTY